MKGLYGKEKSPIYADENVNLLNPEEQPEDAVNANGEAVKEDAEDTPEPDHDTEDKGEDMDGEVVEYTDENGMRVRRTVKKTVTTTTTRTTSGGDESPKNLTRNILEMSHDKPEDDGGEVVEYVDENGRRVRRIVKKTITTISTRKGSNGDESSSFTTETIETSNGDHDPGKQATPQLESKPRSLQDREVFLNFDTKPQAKQESLINVEIKGQSNERAFPRHDLTKTVENKGHTIITTESSGGNKNGDSYSSVYKRTVVTKTIGGGENRRLVEQATKSSGRNSEHPIVVAKKDNSQIDIPEWIEERKSPETQRRHPGMSDISVHLKYPSDYAPKKKEPEERVNESKIRAEVSKRDKPDISILSLDDVVEEKEKGKEEVKKSEKTEVHSAPPQPASGDSEEEDDDDEEEEEYDEFEEEIVVLEVKRRPRYHKGLETPKPEPEKVGVPIEDLLEIPTLQVDQESAPEDELPIDEKIEAVQRPPVVFCELPDFGILGN